MIKNTVTIKRQSSDIQWYIPDEKYKKIIDEYISKKVIVSRTTENLDENTKIITTIFSDIESYNEYRNNFDIGIFILESSTFYSSPEFLLTSSEEYVTD
jgi:hypothetical protein